MANINPKIDLVFKKLFGAEENKDILMSLINSILPSHQQITTLVLKNPYNVSDYAEGKLSILDIKAEDEHGIQYDIEMQIRGSEFYGRRTLFYWAKMFGSQLDYITDEEWEQKKKRGYSELNKCIVISLMDFEFFKDKKYHRCYMLKDRESNEIHRDLDYLDLYFVELEKFTEDLKFVQNTLERWISFLNYAHQYDSKNLPKELAQIKEIRKASAKLEIMYFTEREKQYYDAQQKFLLDEITRLNELANKLAETESKLGETESKLGETESKLGETESKLGETESKLGETESKLGETESKLGETESKLGETESKLGETESKLGETESKLGETEIKLGETQAALEKLRQEAEKKSVEAEKKSKIEIAKKLIALGSDLAIIIAATGLTAEQIHELKKPNL
ncbi:MAG: Rpn family recombination-promoting nuclease/putative transposase [Bacteroidetes bacterium]|nr:MAG: Rpn family recombination-promoting nuclease/putative transposase [Bacteroidota bacterium]